MANVIVILPDSGDQFFENVTLEITNYPPRTVIIRDQDEELLGAFNFDRIVGARYL